MLKVDDLNLLIYRCFNNINLSSFQITLKLNLSLTTLFPFNKVIKLSNLKI